MSQPRLGFIGMGLMGVPMSQRLQQAGYEVRIWNRSPARLESLSDTGLLICHDLAALVADSDILMTCVSDTAAVEEVVFGENGIACYGRDDQILIDFSSIAPEATRDMAARLWDETGIQWVDAPVSGGVAGAEQGTLAIMAGGEAELIEQLRPVLAPLSQRVTRMGDTGAGQVTKICNQMLVSCNVMVMAEMMALAERAGVDARQIPAALQGGFADSIPLQLTGPRMAEQDYEPVRWYVKTLLKDLTMANELADLNESPVPMSQLGMELMRLHASRGFADSDPATLADLFREAP